MWPNGYGQGLNGCGQTKKVINLLGVVLLLNGCGQAKTPKEARSAIKKT